MINLAAAGASAAIFGGEPAIAGIRHFTRSKNPMVKWIDNGLKGAGTGLAVGVFIASVNTAPVLAAAGIGAAAGAAVFTAAKAGRLAGRKIGQRLMKNEKIAAFTAKVASSKAGKFVHEVGNIGKVVTNHIDKWFSIVSRRRSMTASLLGMLPPKKGTGLIADTISAATNLTISFPGNAVASTALALLFGALDYLHRTGTVLPIDPVHIYWALGVVSVAAFAAMIRRYWKMMRLLHKQTHVTATVTDEGVEIKSSVPLTEEQVDALVDIVEGAAEVVTPVSLDEAALNRVEQVAAEATTVTVTTPVADPTPEAPAIKVQSMDDPLDYRNALHDNGVLDKGADIAADIAATVEGRPFPQKRRAPRKTEGHIETVSEVVHTTMSDSTTPRKRVPKKTA